MPDMQNGTTQTTPHAIGYCTNVHAGANLSATRDQLEKHALKVKASALPNHDMPLGLWLSNDTAASLIKDPGELNELMTWLQSHGLTPMTLNGFPYGDFHQDVVKKAVYLPTWESDERRIYTENLVDLLHIMLPTGQRGTISTLPLGWGAVKNSINTWTADQFKIAANQLNQVLDKLRALESRTGRLIQICLEPEPGCVLDSATDIVCFFEQYLKPLATDATRYLTVCHDVCHSAVIFEDQKAAFKAYEQAGITVGKIQVSSAVVASFENKSHDEMKQTLHDLRAFNETRYMHQTCVRLQPDSPPVMYEDLQDALEEFAPEPNDLSCLSGEWRVHYHVPIHLSEVGPSRMLSTTKDDIHQAVKLYRDLHSETHEEIETYAWNVLPEEMTPPDLASGIADELKWYLTHFESSLI